MTVLLAAVALILPVVALHGEGPFLPNWIQFPNDNGTSTTYSTDGGVDLTNPFFQSLGTNGRSCGTCHQPGDGMSVSASHAQDRFELTRGMDPLFRTVDGSNCDHDVDVSTLKGRRAAYSLLRTRGLIRVAVDVPPAADFAVVSVDNPYSCNETSKISMYRRPLPSANLPFLSAVMFDGRESSPLTGTTKIDFSNYPTSLLSNLVHQSIDATNGHAQGDGTRPTPAEQQQIVDFEMALFTAQETARGVGRLDARGATGGAHSLASAPFFISINSSVNFLLPQFEQPGGLDAPGDGKFSPKIFDLFDAWADLPAANPRAAIARGQALFNSKPITITGVKGINDDVSEGGLVPGGVPSLQGTCGTCHDTPNVGNHSFPTPLDIGTGDPGASDALNLGGLDIAYLPKIRACRKDPVTKLPTSECVTTTDLGQALIDGKFDHIGKIKGPVLRGLSSRAPYFHNGSAQTLLEAVRFYEVRFGLVLTPQEESDLIAFLGAL
jgi:hypothetical protein